jgi:hypothetical protein
MQRELRAHTLASTFRALADVGGGPLADRVAQFALAAREVVTSGTAVREPKGFSALLRRVGDLLSQSGSGDETALVAELDSLTASVRALLVPGSVPVPAPAPAPPPKPSAAPAPTAAEDEAPAPESPDLIGSWVSYQRRLEAGIGTASLEALLTTPSRDTTRPRPAPVAPVAATAFELPVVDIRSLLYRGDSALARAQELRVQARLVSGDALHELIEEVCDLVALASEPGPSGP